MFFSRGSIEGVYPLKAEGCHQVIHQPSGFMRLHLLAGVVNLPQLFLSMLYQIQARHAKLMYFIRGWREADYRNLYKFTSLLVGDLYMAENCIARKRNGHKIEGAWQSSVRVPNNSHRIGNLSRQSSMCLTTTKLEYAWPSSASLSVHQSIWIVHQSIKIVHQSKYMVGNWQECIMAASHSEPDHLSSSRAKYMIAGSTYICFISCPSI